MQNHTILKIDREAALKWRDDEIISRWTKLYNPSPIVGRYLNGMKLSKAELDVVDEEILKWRHRLNISWFMRNLNESISRPVRPVALGVQMEEFITNRFNV
jgi:hypothetical protein